MAFNNYFFFNGLHPETQDKVPPPSKRFTQEIDESFSSLEALRDEFLATAEAMFGPGFVWLVKTNQQGDRGGGTMKIMNTYGAGSPFPQAHYRMQPVETSTETTNVLGGRTYSAAEIERMSRPQNSVGSFGRHSAGAKRGQLASGGAQVEPLLCVNTWEHVWLRDWGVHAKRDFVEAWWKSINWAVVEQEAAMHSSFPGVHPSSTTSFPDRLSMFR